MLRGLALLFVAEGAVFRPHPARTAPRGEARHAAHASALLQGARAALALLVFCAIWYATQWDQGLAGITGLALMNYQCVNNDDPAKLGWPYLRAVAAACLAAYATMGFIYPWLEGFEALALFLLAVLVPAGLLIGTRAMPARRAPSPSSMSRRRRRGTSSPPIRWPSPISASPSPSACSSASWWRASCR